MWVALPLILFTFTSIEPEYKNNDFKRIFSRISIPESIARLSIKSFKKSLFTTLIVLFLLSFFTFSSYVYRDSYNRAELYTEFKSDGLHGIYSTKERVLVVDQVISEIMNYSEKGDKVLMVGSIPMFYYLTETIPAYGEGWINIYQMEAIKEMMNKSINEGNYPKVFIYSKIDTRSNTWPEHAALPDKDAEILQIFIDEYVVDLNYTLLWENDYFAIYGNPEIY